MPSAEDRDGDATRKRILNAVSQTPGINKSELQRMLDLGWGTLTHHLRVMENNHLIGVVRNPRELMLYPLFLDAKEARRRALVRIDACGVVLAHLAENQGSRLTDIARAVGLSIHAVRRQLEALDQEGLVTRSGTYMVQFHIDERALELVRKVRQEANVAAR